jgi:prepilin-type processing-associated H-X9-DG protein
MAFFGIVVAAIGLLGGFAAWIFGGGALLMVGGRYIVKTPKATYWRSVGTIVLAGLASSMIVTLASAVSFGLLGPVGIVGALAGAAAGLLVTWLIIKAMFAVSFGKAILAWLPTLALAIVALPIVGMLTAMIVPAVQQALDQTNRTKCTSNMISIGSAITFYRAVNDDKWPADLTALTPEYVRSPAVFVCRCVRDDTRPAGRTCDYFYLPPTSSNASQAIVACDFDGNHRDGSRNVLYADGSVRNMPAGAFQAALADPANAAFAAALRRAEP